MQGAPQEPGPTPREQLDALGQAVITTDVQGTVVYWNPAAEDLYGWTAEEAVGRNIAELSVPDVAQEIAEDIMAALRNGVAWSGGFPCRRKDGSMFPALVTDAGIHRDGELVGIIGVSTNLGTAVRPLVERSTDAALVLRSDAVITYASPAVNQLFGWPEEEIVGSSVVPLLHPEDRTTLADFLADVVARPGVHPPVELRVRRDGAWVWAEAALTNLLDDPHVRGVVCNLRASWRREAQEAAEARAAQLQAALLSRLVIERAKGFLSGRDGVDPEEAFERMRRHARSRQVSVQVVAQHVLDGDLVPEA
ncbi:PAS domain S-box protein [Nocardioides mesophilus]|uniref:PAS domain S-box protein n=1 Tax=Nocardioides mesophilus TaxID=433659 RepID=A0A7G9REW5_9ACTN|nr:PAS domain S-box protein [Nocardioides mesophilus]QNN54140.1 PAS domain S-box protein [Nocardioides mesophilus]